MKQSLSPDNVTRKILQFQNLKPGWHLGIGVTPTPYAIQQAFGLHLELVSHGFVLTNAFPGPNGEVQVTAYQDDWFVEITVEPNSEKGITFVFEKADEELVYQEGLTVQAVKTFIKEAQHAIWPTSASLILFTSTLTEKNSQVWPSKTPLTKAGYPFLKTNAQLTPARRFVPTSIGFMPDSRKFRRYTGRSPKKLLEPLFSASNR